MNKFKILDETIKHLGSSPQEILQYWVTNNFLSSDFLRKVVNTKIAVETDIFSCLRIGWYVFKGGQFSPYPDTFPDPIGVVAWLKPDLNAKAGERGLVILFDEYYGIWSLRNLLFGVCDSGDGAQNTQIMLQRVKSLKTSIPVAEFCEKVSDNIDWANAFIPAYKQLDKIASSYSIIRDAFEAVGKTFHPFLFSSTEVDSKYVICMDMTTAAVLKRVKVNSAHMYPIMTF